MNEQQERIVGDILSTVRSLQRSDNQELISIVAKIADENFKNQGMRYMVKLVSYNDTNGNVKKIQIIKIIREYSGLGLRDAKEIVDQLDIISDDKIIMLEDLDKDSATKVVNDLEVMGLKPTMEIQR